MSDHFSYLYDDDAAEFFQKEACAAADAALPRANEIVKTAAPVDLNAYSAEKVCSRLDQDLFIVKTAGESGFNLGAVSRSMAHMDRFLENTHFEPETAIEVFDKFAAEAIQHDLNVVREELYKLAEEEHRPWVDQEIAAAGIELVKAAELDKEALLGIARTIKAVGRGLKSTKGMGFGARAKSVATAPKRAWRGRRTEVAAAKRGKAQKRLQSAQKKLQTVKAKHVARLQQASKIPSAGVKASVTPGVKTRAAKAIKKQQAKVQKRTTKLTGAESKLDQRRALSAGKKQPPAKPTDDLTKKKDALKKNDKDTQDKLKKTTEEPPKQKAAETETGSGGSGGETTLSGAAKKMRDSGWGSLSGAEKQKLINAGVAGVVGHRVVMGQGAVTGGKGII